ncbi:uncharacterized protein LOC108491253 [Nannospalax galili]|uniref:uncharacterized protein LOC108491253 n=1 Tax=Nannospalax galili TaxID=1026970 RepID=UPI000819C305|nr:uncharacterized protein LOC108491253 [Nannospalax galili]
MLAGGPPGAQRGWGAPPCSYTILALDCAEGGERAHLPTPPPTPWEFRVTPQSQRLWGCASAHWSTSCLACEAEESGNHAIEASLWAVSEALTSEEPSPGRPKDNLGPPGSGKDPTRDKAAPEGQVRVPFLKRRRPAKL